MSQTIYRYIYTKKGLCQINGLYKKINPKQKKNKSKTKLKLKK